MEVIKLAVTVVLFVKATLATTETPEVLFWLQPLAHPQKFNMVLAVLTAEIVAVDEVA
jgi:hypothetical protein